MTLQPPFSPDAIDSLVRDYLDDASRDVDVERTLAAILRRAGQVPADDTLDADPLFEARPRLARFRQGWRWAAAAALIVACGLGWHLAVTPEPANAYALVSAAESELARATDRCYQVESIVPKAWRRSNPWLQTDSSTRLWTRGDRFRVLARHDGRDVVWGQDHERRMWVAVDGQPGLRYGRTEVPPMFARTRAYLGLDIRKLANRFLQHFDLQVIERRRDGQTPLVVVRATAKAGEHPGPINAARLEIEPKTKRIRKLELLREADGAQKARFTFTLIDEAAQPEAKYELEGNLPAGAEILDADRATHRDELYERLTQGTSG